MVHGIDSYFLERARAARRVSLIAVGLGGCGLALLFGLARTPAAQRMMRDTVRIGYEGERQFVERVSLQQSPDPSEQLRDLGQLLTRSAHRGGQVAVVDRDRSARPHTLPQVEGEGDAEADALARARARASTLPVIQSDDLTIEYQVRPVYPEVLLEKNIEGKVTVLALIDTVGRVIDVGVQASTGEALMEQAATTAVLQYRFRPFRVDGVAREVYARIPFAFRIY